MLYFETTKSPPPAGCVGGEGAAGISLRFSVLCGVATACAGQFARRRGLCLPFLSRLCNANELYLIRGRLNGNTSSCFFVGPLLACFFDEFSNRINFFDGPVNRVVGQRLHDANDVLNAMIFMPWRLFRAIASCKPSRAESGKVSKSEQIFVFDVFRSAVDPLVNRLSVDSKASCCNFDLEARLMERVGYTPSKR
jgi:hypothetical protein